MTLKISWPSQEPFLNLSGDDTDVLTMYYGGMHETALARLETLIRQKPERLDLILMKGHVLRQLGDSSAAAGAYSQALNRDPQNYTANYYYALSSYMSGEFKNALSSLESFMKVSREKNIDHQRNLFLLKGMSEIETKKYSQAADTFAKLNELYPNFSPYLHWLARSYEKAGEVAKARDAYLSAYKNDTSNFEILFDAAPLLLKSGDIENAYKYYKKIYEKLKSDYEIKKIYNELAAIYKNLMAQKPQAKTFKPLEPKKTAPLNIAGEEISVGLSTDDKGEPLGVSSVKLKASGKFVIYKDSGRRILFTGNDSNINENEYELYFKKKSFYVKNLNSGKTFELGSEDLFLKPAGVNDTVLFRGIKVGAASAWESSESRYYRGGFKFVRNKDNFYIVNKIGLEKYLLSVLPSEMPANFPAEALMAQAICARSEALYKKNAIKRHAKFGYDLCDDQHCQMYRGVSWEQPGASEAVIKTAGKVVMYNRKVCDAIYSDNCGGYTQSSSDITGWGDIKYLSAASNLRNGGGNIFNPLFLEQFVSAAGDTYCRAEGNIKNYQSRWIRRIDAKTINESLKSLEIGDILRIIPRRRSFSGHIDSIEIIGTKGRKTIKNELKIRKLFAYSPLRSSKFIVETACDKKGRPRFFMFIGAGFGHGVGMCQSGAYGMAREGQNHGQIINHYFKGAQISSLY